MRIVIARELSVYEKKQWIELFCFCFSKTESCALNIFKKYEINESIFCLLYADGRLVANYSGLFARSRRLNVFLSTDTMSNGHIKGGSILCAEYLYEKLIELGIDIVCGYPNKKIAGMREQKLNWKYVKSLNLYILPAFLRYKTRDTFFWINRPEHGFFSERLKLFCLGNYNKSSFSIFRLELADTKPHHLAINLTKLFGFGEKKLYWLILSDRVNSADIVDYVGSNYSSASIDVP